MPPLFRWLLRRIAIAFGELKLSIFHVCLGRQVFEGFNRHLVAVRAPLCFLLCRFEASTGSGEHVFLGTGFGRVDGFTRFG